jgi:hypothetical protein
VLIAVHPSALLRLRDEQDKRAAYGAFVGDLRSVARLGMRQKGRAWPDRVASTG